MHIQIWLKDKWITFWEAIQREKVSLLALAQNTHKNPHHSRSSCPNPPASCGWNDYSNGPTTNELIGALVGGCKNADDNYNDARDDYFSNEVTLDYNAGFQSTVAGLQMKKCCSA